MPRLTKAEFFASAPAHLVQAVKDGKSAHINGETYTLESLGIDVANMADGVVDALISNEAKDTIIANLRETVEKQNAQILDFESKGATPAADHSELLEMLIPNSESQLKNKSEAVVTEIAKYRSIETEGKSKDDLVAAILAKPEGS